MLKQILPEHILKIIDSKLDFTKIYELRLRAGCPITVNYGGKYFYLSINGVSESLSSILICDKRLIEAVVYKASEYSVYAINNQLKNSFITLKNGVRIGICGEVVIDEGEIRTIKNFCSLIIRVPHSIENCALNASRFIFNKRILNTLVISPPGAGKTTFLRDLARLSGVNSITNTLIIDERHEIAACNNGQAQLDVGKYCDVISGCSKQYGFEQGIRAMRPDLIITDELIDKNDYDAVFYASGCGVKIIASIHAQDHLDLVHKKDFEILLKNNIFNIFVVLSDRRGPGTCEGIFDTNFNPLYIN